MKKILKTLCAKYEYLILDTGYNIIQYSHNVINFFDLANTNIKNMDIFELMPELVGVEKELEKIFDEKSESLIIPNISKNDHYYINIHAYPGEIFCSDTSNATNNKTLIILLEDITEKITIEQSIKQERNENALLLTEIAKKNAELKKFNEQMQDLVQAEIKKNLEKQKELELKSRYAQMGEMIAMVTHQWKQPLSTISLLTYSIKLKRQRGKLNKDTIDNISEKISSQVNFMNQTVVDFQHFFNPMKEKINFNLKETLSTIVTLIQHEYQTKNIDLVLTGDKSISAYGYPNEYNQVILSIVSNAKDAFLSNPHDNMKIEITVEAYNEVQSIVKIKDNAGGIPESIKSNIFDRHTTTKHTGSGIGLNIAKNIITVNMNGKINVNDVDNGTQFSIIV